MRTRQCPPVTACCQQKGQGYGPERICFPGGVALAADQGSIRRGRRGVQVDGGHRRVDRPVAELPDYGALTRRDEGRPEDDKGVSEESRQHAQRQLALRSRGSGGSARPVASADPRARPRLVQGRDTNDEGEHWQPVSHAAEPVATGRGDAEQHDLAPSVRGRTRRRARCTCMRPSEGPAMARGTSRRIPPPKGVDAGVSRPRGARAASRWRETAGQPSHFHRDR